MSQSKCYRFCFLLLLLACTDEEANKTEMNAQIEKQSQSKALSTAIQVEPMAVGIALQNSVLVYADTTKQAAVIDTLGLADHALVIGTKDKHKLPVFASHGWLRLEKNFGRWGWARRKSLALVTRLVFKVSPGDSLFLEPMLHSTVVQTYSEPFRAGTEERVINEGRIWLGLRWQRGADFYWINRWLLSKSPNYDRRDAYGSILFQYLGFGSDYVRIPDYIFRENHDFIWEIINRLEPLLSPADTLNVELTIGDALPIGAGVLIPYAKSQIYRRSEQYDAAIAELEKITLRPQQQPLFYGRSAPEARLGLAEVHAEKGDTNQAIEQYHFLISHYPDEPREGSEWNDWVDDLAVRTIHKFLLQDAVRLYRESDRILAESSVPAVKLLAYAGKARSLGLQGLRQQMIDTALVATTRYPEVMRQFYQNKLNYANLVTAAVFAVLEEQADVAGFKQFAEKVQMRFPRHIIGATAALRLALFADKTDATLAEVERLYTRAVNDFDLFAFYDSELNQFLGTHMAKGRLERLQDFKATEAEIVQDAVELKKGAGKQFPAITKLARGAHVETLYTDKFFLMYPNSPPQFAKVKLVDGTIGWVKMEYIKTLDGSSIPD